MFAPSPTTTASPRRRTSTSPRTPPTGEAGDREPLATTRLRCRGALEHAACGGLPAFQPVSISALQLALTIVSRLTIWVRVSARSVGVEVFCGVLRRCSRPCGRVRFILLRSPSTEGRFEWRDLTANYSGWFHTISGSRASGARRTFWNAGDGRFLVPTFFGIGW